ncbi:hypothetical protein BDZ97DRAFT_1922803 [Flammula alnicola]|nr:hypothetical protein BDZ97DRAFT_1922803 [Flammula alnicola]
MTYDLRSLKIPFSSVSDPSFIPALERCPSLVSLCIFSPTSDERSRDVQIENLSRTALPSLTVYEGPHTHVLQFSHRPLERVVLWGFDDRPSVCNPEALVDTLADLAETSTVNSLRSLKTMVVDITNDLLEVFSSFTHLESIIIQSQDSSPRDMPIPHPIKSTIAVTSLYNMMNKISLPPNVKYIKFSTRLGSPRIDLAEQEHEAACFMESFASRHPRIQHMDIDYGIYWTGMYSAVWGRIRENNERSESGVDHITRDNTDNGYSSKSSSRHFVLSTVVSTVHPLPLGKLTFTEHRRTILFAHDTSGILSEDDELHAMGERRFWMLIWTRFRRFFGKPDT